MAIPAPEDNPTRLRCLRAMPCSTPVASGPSAMTSEARVPGIQEDPVGAVRASAACRVTDAWTPLPWLLQKAVEKPGPALPVRPIPPAAAGPTEMAKDTRCGPGGVIRGVEAQTRLRPLGPLGTPILDVGPLGLTRCQTALSGRQPDPLLTLVERAHHDPEGGSGPRRDAAPQVAGGLHGVDGVDDHVQTGSQAILGDLSGRQVGGEPTLEARRDPRASHGQFDGVDREQDRWPSGDDLRGDRALSGAGKPGEDQEDDRATMLHAATFGVGRDAVNPLEVPRTAQVFRTAVVRPAR